MGRVLLVCSRCGQLRVLDSLQEGQDASHCLLHKFLPSILGLQSWDTLAESP